MRKKATVLRLLVLSVCIILCNTADPINSKSAASSSESNDESGGFFVLDLPSTDRAMSGIAWKPDGSYVLLIALDRHGYGSEIFKYDGSSYTLLLNDTDIIIQSVAWHPEGSYALITSHYYANQNHRYRLLRYDGSNFSTITEGGIYDMRGIAWKPDGSYALIVGGDFSPGRMIWKYDGENLTRIYDGDSSFSKFMKAQWKPDGSYALLIDFFSTIFKYDGAALTELTSFDTLSINGLSWSADGSYALVTAWYNLEWEEHLVVLRFDGVEFADVTYQTGTGNRLRGISSSDRGGTLIVGAGGIVLKYDGSTFTLLTEGVYPGLGSVRWKPDGSQALITGGGGTLLLLYVPDPAIIVVPDDFLTIQAAINNASEGDTIFVRNGTYYEHLVVNKALTLQGENRNTTIIDGEYLFASVVNVTADNVKFSGFTIQHCSGGGRALWLDNYGNMTFSDNIITGCNEGVRLHRSSGNVVSDNIVQDCHYNTGVGIDYGVNNTVHRNTIINNHFGLSGGIDCHGNTFSENTIINNDVGFGTTSYDNKFFHNNFVGNGVHVIVSGINQFDNGCEGNYWSDYEDRYPNASYDQYGIWNTSYVINAENVDRFPLRNPYWNLADLNHDLKVDIFDLVTMCPCYCMDWQEHMCHVDIAEPYGIINIFDVVTVAINYARAPLFNVSEG